MNARTIPLTRGKVALVSPEDYERLNRYKWQAHVARGAYYATRGDTTSGRQRTVRMHRVIMDAPDGIEVDHINGDGLDNRRENLRLSTHRENGANQRISYTNRSGFKGVYRVGSSWAANVGTTYLGLYATAELAARAYDTEARRRFGAFAHLNFPHDTASVGPRVGGPPKTNTSGFRGVSYRKDQGKWTARIRENGARIHLGYFSTAEAAAQAIALRACATT